MGKPIANELFLQKLQQIYQGTRSWGTVRVQIKRLFEERQKYKKTLAKERQQDRVADCKEPNKEFSLVVKAATPRRKVSTLVTADQASSFEQKMSTVMQQAIFRQVLERQEREKKEKKKKGGKANKDEAKGGAASKASKREPAGKIKKNRKERRKDLSKQKRKLNLQKIKAERLAAKAGSAPAAAGEEEMKE